MSAFRLASAGSEAFYVSEQILVEALHFASRALAFTNGLKTYVTFSLALQFPAVKAL